MSLAAFAQGSGHNTSHVSDSLCSSSIFCSARSICSSKPFRMSSQSSILSATSSIADVTTGDITCFLSLCCWDCSTTLCIMACNLKYCFFETPLRSSIMPFLNSNHVSWPSPSVSKHLNKSAGSNPESTTFRSSSISGNVFRLTNSSMVRKSLLFTSRSLKALKTSFSLRRCSMLSEPSSTLTAAMCSAMVPVSSERITNTVIST
mmetsp:Transcript_57860/g.152322  ORF Transcript_57860/g.152322 Transcript_57860/m.152322 type:complete len:205 (-) Transcript_57860:880-1494(-)